VRRARGLLVAAVVALVAGLPSQPSQARGGPTAPSPQVARWNADQIDLAPALAPGRGGAGVTVAVLDTWVDATHPDFGGRVLAGASCHNGTCTPGGTTTADGCEAHGTHVAGIVASSSYGVAPRARILPVRVLFSSTDESGCVANSNDVANGVLWAAAHGARVINISLGEAYPVGGQITALADAVNRVSAQGDLVVAAAGNQAAPVGTSYGSAAIVVAATGPTGALASYSQRGKGVSFAAPGGDPGHATCTSKDCVVSTWAGGEYAALAGTSMAAAHVSGLAALLLGQDPARTRAQVLSLLARSARPLADAGYGLIDAAAALHLAPATSPARPVSAAAKPARASHPATAGLTRPSVSAAARPTLRPARPARARPATRARSPAGTPSRRPDALAAARTTAGSALAPAAGVASALVLIQLLLLGLTLLRGGSRLAVVGGSGRQPMAR
jgi:subtilisin family serine protease